MQNLLRKRFIEDIYEMTGVRLSLYWSLMWRFVAPVLIAVMLCASIVSQFMEMPTYSAWNKDKVIIINQSAFSIMLNQLISAVD